MKAIRTISKEEKEICKRFIIEELNRKRGEELTRFLKMLCFLLNSEFGFGKQRIEKLIDSMKAFTEENRGNEIFWDKIDMKLIDDLKLPFEREDYEKCEEFMKENNRKRNI